MVMRLFLRGRRKGLAPIVATALIILGVVIGIVLLWIFASKSINRGRDVINPDCFTVDIRLNSCVAYGFCSYESGTGSYRADVLMRRGVGRADLTGIRFSFEDGFQRKGVYDYNLTSVQLEELQSLQLKDPVPASVPVVSTSPYLVRAIALLGDNRDVCPQTTEPVYCSIARPAPNYGSIPNFTAVPGTPFVPNIKGGYCCQCPRNYSECYDPGVVTPFYPGGMGTDPNYPINVTGSVNHLLPGPGGVLVPVTAPPGNRSVCCIWDPLLGPGNTCPVV